jgi:hypothetical protein
MTSNQFVQRRILVPEWAIESAMLLPIYLPN